jgi:hypothetical protein
MEVPAKFDAAEVLRACQAIGCGDGDVLAWVLESGVLYIVPADAPDGSAGFAIVSPIEPYGVDENGKPVEKTRRLF